MCKVHLIRTYASIRKSFPAIAQHPHRIIFFSSSSERNSGYFTFYHLSLNENVGNRAY